MKPLLLFAALSIGFASEYPKPEIREEQQVVVNGATETWRLQWEKPPHSACEPGPMAPTCPCEGFAYAEAGDLDLVRLRDGREIDRLPLNPLFTETLGDGAMIQRWRHEDSDSMDIPDSSTLEKIARRPTVQVMNFADYDHDGQKTEFYLQTEALPCGKSQGVVIGVSKLNPRLHAFGTAEKPAEPLYMQKREWEALSRATHPVEVVDWLCEDHGADEETTMRLGWTPAGITAEARRWTCPGGFQSGKLIPK